MNISTKYVNWKAAFGRWCPVCHAPSRATSPQNTEDAMEVCQNEHDYKRSEALTKKP